MLLSIRQKFQAVEEFEPREIHLHVNSQVLSTNLVGIIENESSSLQRHLRLTEGVIRAFSKLVKALSNPNTLSFAIDEFHRARKINKQFGNRSDMQSCYRRYGELLLLLLTDESENTGLSHHCENPYDRFTLSSSEIGFSVVMNNDFRALDSISVDELLRIQAPLMKVFNEVHPGVYSGDELVLVLLKTSFCLAEYFTLKAKEQIQQFASARLEAKAE
jgi:hypothetical protein